MEENPALLIIVLVLILFGVLAFVLHYNSHAETIKRQLRKAKLMTSTSFVENTYGKVLGTVKYVKDPMKAPLTGRACTCYEVIVEQYNSNNKGGGTWTEILHEYEGQDFCLEDKDGRTYVEMYGGKVTLVKDAHFESGTFNDASEELERFLARHNKSSAGLVFNKSLRYKEGVLEAGESAAACGQGQYKTNSSEPTAAPGLVLAQAEAMPLYVSDDLDAIRY